MLNTNDEKYSEMAANYYNMLKVAESLPEDIRVYVVNHVEDTNNGDTKIKTIGRMLDEKVDIPSLLTIALGATKVKEGHRFRTQSTGRDFFKSPEDMFEDDLIDNDLKIVDDAIKDYYEIKE